LPVVVVVVVVVVVQVASEQQQVFQLHQGHLLQSQSVAADLLE
jgi:hypothetical protein